MNTRIGPRRRPALLAPLTTLCIGALAAGCASAPARFYTLAPTATAGPGPAAAYAIVVGPVSLPAEVDRPEFVVQVAPNRVALDEFNRWAAPLGEGIARTVAGNSLGPPRHPTRRDRADRQPQSRLSDHDRRAALRIDPGAGILLEAIWAVRKAAGGEPRSGRTVAREVVDGRASTRSPQPTAGRSPP